MSAMMMVTIKKGEKDNHRGEEKGAGYSIEEELKVGSWLEDRKDEPSV
jgi:hypothetical protein